jgi:hypothetical protein
MDDPQRFRQKLAAQIIALLGAAWLLTPPAACGGAPSNGSTTGAGGTKHAGSSGAGAGTTSSVGSAATGGAPATGGAATTGGAPATGGASSTGGAPNDGGAGGSGGMGGSGQPSFKTCFDFPVDGGIPYDGGTYDGATCPTDPATALAIFEAYGCPKGLEPSQIVMGPLPNTPSQCCYMAYFKTCGPGGRPYLDGEVAQLASVERGVSRSDWADAAAARPSVDGLTPEERASLAEAWTAAALFEHASVASFSRASLELMAAGAPGDLVELAHRAALDEVRHAKLCFALASAYAGEAIAPGPFPLGSEVRLRTSLVEIAAATVEEGCVGETVAAVVAAEQLARATDPAVRAALEQIAADEARHAELAWRTAAWAVQAGGDEVREAVARALLGAIAAPREEVATTSGPAVEGHGLLGASARVQVAAAALAEVVRPCARALLQRGAPPACHDDLARGAAA